MGAIKWSLWHIFWVDERVVPKDHPDSNYKLAYDGFLSKVDSLLVVLNLHMLCDVMNLIWSVVIKAAKS